MGNNKIFVKSLGQKGNVKITHDLSLLYTKLSAEWAVKMDGLVENTDYSSKYYAGESKKQADIVLKTKTSFIEDVGLLIKSCAEQVALAKEYAQMANGWDFSYDEENEMLVFVENI